VVAFDLLFALYQEEARHRGLDDEEEWQPRAIVERILGHNLYGIDLDARAVQIGAAALWLKAQQTCAGARPAQLNLVASNLRLAADHLGSPAKNRSRLWRCRDEQQELRLKALSSGLSRCRQTFSGHAPQPCRRRWISPQPRRVRIHAPSCLEAVPDAAHSSANELGPAAAWREQLAAGVRFVRMVKEATYHLVVGKSSVPGHSEA
jgi:hypothetical protein